MIPYKQLSLSDVFIDCQQKFEDDKPAFLALLENHIDLDEIIPASFVTHFYASTGRPRKYPLYAMLWALIIQRLFTIQTDKLLLTFLNHSKELRDFCGFNAVPDASKITRFKQEFRSDLQSVFDNLVDITEPICQQIDSEKANMTIFDSSGMEAYVTENNPKYLNRTVTQVKSYAKSKSFDKNYNPHTVAYAMMPSSASANPEVKQLYINGHFCYVFKFGLITNGLGITRHIAFYNKDFMDSHPEITLDKKTDSPDEDKSVHDSRLLMPTLKEFFEKHPLIHPKIFLGDAAFDSTALYRQLLADASFNQNKNFSVAYIPLNKRSSLKDSRCHIDENGIPHCPKDHSSPMKKEGNKTDLYKNGMPRQKFICPKTRWVICPDRKYRRKTSCDNPCTTSIGGRMTYIYPEQNLRAYPGTLRGSKEWGATYKTRAVVEQTIHHFKEHFCVANRKTHNAKTIHADLLLSGITQLITVVLADKIHQHQYIRSLKPLIA